LSPCGRYFNINTGKYAGTKGKAPEAATIITLGFYCGNLNLASILKLNNLCNQYGLNTYPAGDAIQLAMNLYEKGVITKKDTDGLELDWGNEEAQFELIHKMALREGFGNKLAEGPYSFSRIIGKGAERLYPHNYGSSRGSGYYGLPLGLLYMTSTRGADHLRGVSERYPPSLWKGRGLSKLNESAIILGQHEWVLADSLERCKSAVNTWSIGCPLHDPLGEGRAALLSAATGWKVTAKDLDKLAERVYNIERSFNVREGAIKKYDCPPWKSLNMLVDGRTTTTPEEVEKLLTNYYVLRGWDPKSGIPTRKKLKELDLEYVADEIESNLPYKDWSGPPLWSLDKYPHGGLRAGIL
jgi:aldehyde:ferredoxin oxidoreductase